MPPSLLRPRFVGLLLLPAAVATAAVLVVYHTHHPDFQLLRWDALHYHSIRAGGYRFVAHAQCNAGFFPLFPYLWRGLGLSAVGVGALNYGLAVAAVLALAWGLGLWRPAVLLYMALPTSVFFYLPYTEALFFAATSGVLLGLARQRPAWVVAGLLLSALTRPSGLYLLPALAAVGYQQYGQPAPPPDSRQAGHGQILGYLAMPAVGIGLVVLEQWRATGVWLAYLKAQMEWDHAIKPLHLPFSDASQGILLLDGLALLCGVGAGVWAARQLWRRVPGSPVLLFSAVFVASATGHLLLHAPLEHGYTSLISLHRYVLGTPFALVLLAAFVPRQRPAWPLAAGVAAAVLVLAALLGLLGGGTLTFRSLGPRQVPGLLLVLPLLAYTLTWTLASYRLGRAALYGVGVLLQALLLRNFLLGHWVG
jgi:hypothetical protein